jgi:hypothetical protein
MSGATRAVDSVPHLERLCGQQNTRRGTTPTGIDISKNGLDRSSTKPGTSQEQARNKRRGITDAAMRPAPHRHVIGGRHTAFFRRHQTRGHSMRPNTLCRPSGAPRRRLPPPCRPGPACLLALTFLVLAGCHREPVPQHPSGADPVASRSQDSVAAPLASLPVPDAAMAPAQPIARTTTTDAGGGPSQASQTSLSKEQESSAMPLAGQSNNHSTPAPTAPTQASDSPPK